MSRVTTQTPEQFDAEHGSELTEPIPGAAAVHALMSNAGGGVDFIEADLPEWARKDNLRKDGCDLILFGYAFLRWQDCPPDACDFVIALMGLSRGNSKDWLPITDDKISDYTGLTRQTISKKRKALIAWEQKTVRAAVHITEREFDPNTGKYKPTLYQVIITDYVEKFVRVARERFSWMRSSTALVDRAIDEGMKELADEVGDEMPIADLTRRKKHESTPRQKTSGAKAKGEFDQLVSRFRHFCEARADNPNALAADIERLYESYGEIAEEYLKPRKSQ